MMTLYHNVTVFKLQENGETRKHFPEPVSLRTEYDPQGVSLSFFRSKLSHELFVVPNKLRAFPVISMFLIISVNETSGTVKLLETLLERGNPLMRLGRCGFIICIETVCILFKFNNEQGKLKRCISVGLGKGYYCVVSPKDASSFQVLTSKALKGNETSVFAERTEDSSALQYFQVIEITL